MPVFRDRTRHFHNRPLLAVFLTLCVTVESAAAAEPTISDNPNAHFFDQSSGSGSSLNFVAFDGTKTSANFDKGNALTIRSKPDTALEILVQTCEPTLNIDEGIPTPRPSKQQVVAPDPTSWPIHSPL